MGVEDQVYFTSHFELLPQARVTALSSLLLNVKLEASIERGSTSTVVLTSWKAFINSMSIPPRSSSKAGVLYASLPLGACEWNSSSSTNSQCEKAGLLTGKSVARDSDVRGGEPFYIEEDVVS